MRAFAIVTEPANYTLDLIENVYRPKGVDFCFLHSFSSAANNQEPDADILDDLSFARRIRYFRRILKSHDAFVINSYTERMNFEFIVLNLLFFRKPFAIESDTELRIPGNVIKRAVKRLFLGWLFSRKCCYGFPGGEHGHVSLFAHYGMSSSRIIVMPMVVDNVRYRRAAIQSRNAKFTFGYLGRLISHKQVDGIINALPNDCKLRIIGAGNREDSLRACVKGKDVEFCGALFGIDKIGALHSVDCLVLYSSYEPWGLVVNEALAAGIPVIVSDRVGCRHDLVLGENPTGLVVKWNDVADLRTAMVRMSSDRPLRRQMSENAVRRMAQWNYDYYGRQLDRYLEEVSHAS